MPEQVQSRLYIDGEFVEPDDKEWFPSVDPYTGKKWIEIPRGTPTDVNRAVRAAHRAAFNSEWSDLTQTERGEFLYALADALVKDPLTRAELDVRDNGKPIRELKSQHEAIPEWYRFYAGLADKIRGSTIPTDKPNKHVYTVNEPIGVVAAITPWNSPLMLATWKLAPALAAGNTVVLKPDEKTSASALAFAEVIDEVGFPDGTVNIVTGYGEEVGQALVEHKLVDIVSFTGGTETGQHIAREAGDCLKRTTMELGGKSPNIVFPDANLENAVNGSLAGIFAAAGQSCSAGSRLLLHTDIHDEFVDRLVQKATQITLGDPKASSTEMGPLASTEQFEKISKYVEIGRDSGAILAHGGGPPDRDLDSDLFFEPTIFTNVSNDSQLAQEEIFGPVLAVIEFESEAQAVELANDVAYGLAAGIWTEDMRKANRVARAMRAGRVWINNYRNSSFAAPQGGFKASGWGRENGIEAIEEFTETKSIWVELGETTENFFE